MQIRLPPVQDTNRGAGLETASEFTVDSRQNGKRGLAAVEGSRQEVMEHDAKQLLAGQEFRGRAT